MPNPLNRRLELLKLEGLGLSRAQVVTALSKKMQVSTRTCWRDFETRTSWQPLLSELNPQELLSKIINRHEFCYAQAGRMYVDAHSDLAKLTALSVMLKANRELYELGVVPDLQARLQALEQNQSQGHKATVCRIEAT